MNAFTKSLVIMMALVIMAGCTGTPSKTSGGSSHSSSYTIGVTVTGLTGSGLVLQDNSGDNLTITGKGTSTFATKIVSGRPYSVSVLTQPSTPTQTCTVANGSGTANANVTNVQVQCVVPTISIGGSVSGLSGTGLVLQDNGGDNLTITGSGNFTFPTLLISGATYKVTVLTQPSGPVQACTVTNGSGTASANVTSVQVVCPAAFFTIGGSVIGALPNPGKTVLQNNGGDNLPVPTNIGFTFASPIADNSSYDVTVFIQPDTLPNPTQPQICNVAAGTGVATANVSNIVIDCGHNDWAWMDGGNVGNSPGATDIPPAPPPAAPPTSEDAATPGGRLLASTWTDNDGNLWLFGGLGYTTDINVFPQPAYLNEMWEYTGTQNYTGSFYSYWNGIAPAIASPVPAGRWGAVTWTDAAGNLWLFGGQDGFTNFLNDLWTYNIGTSTWTEVNPGGLNQSGVYGTEGTPSASNYPGGRWAPEAKIDASGAVWLFGGEGFDGVGTNGLLNDLWTYNATTGMWTWVSGSNVVGKGGVYGTKGTPASTNVPGARQASVAWLDNSGNFWLFGGYDIDSMQQQNALNDLWEYSSGQWTWVAGSMDINAKGSYGIVGMASSTNVPGARWSSAGWTDLNGNLWLFGGQGFDSTGNGTLNDLWEFKGGQWIWQKGPNSVDQPGVYGNAPDPYVAAYYFNNPGARWGASYWTSPNNTNPVATYDQLWMFGGEGYDSVGTNGNTLLNDLWRYVPMP